MSSVNANSSADFPGAITMWYNEVINPGFNSANIDPFVFNSGNGHYTQVRPKKEYQNTRQ